MATFYTIMVFFANYYLLSSLLQTLIIYDSYNLAVDVNIILAIVLSEMVQVVCN